MTPITLLPRCAALGKCEPELVGLHGRALTRGATRRLRFVIYAAGWLHSTVLHRPTAAATTTTTVTVAAIRCSGWLILVSGTAPDMSSIVMCR